MASVIPPPLIVHLSGTSLTSGPLCSPPRNWDLELIHYMESSELCKGRVIFVNTGRGSRQSNWAVSQSAIFAPMRPTHLLLEDFSINDCAPIAPPNGTGDRIAVLDARANLAAACTAYSTANPDVIISVMTMSPASADDANRPDHIDWVEGARSFASDNGLTLVDNYATWAANGNVPLPTELTQQLDKLHPTWDGFRDNSFDNLKAWADAAMEAHFQ